MTANEIKQLLPVLTAFAEGRSVQFRDRRYTDDWATINPKTTEFRIVDLDPVEWRVKPDGCHEGY